MDITDQLWNELAKAFSIEQIFEVIALVGFYHTVSYFANGLRLRAEPSATSPPEQDPWSRTDYGLRPSESAAIACVLVEFRDDRKGRILRCFPSDGSQGRPIQAIPAGGLPIGMRPVTSSVFRSTITMSC